MNINFEQDKQDSLTKVDDAASLSEQVTKLQTMERDLSQKEDAIKKLKKDIEVISGEVIPTMMQEMNLSTLKLSGASFSILKILFFEKITSYFLFTLSSEIDFVATFSTGISEISFHIPVLLSNEQLLNKNKIIRKQNNFIILLIKNFLSNRFQR